ncbi:NucA/NucB deoxyribonuclease domain-containing protein (plasmid) [Streptomyces sp. NBC_01220]|uniref:NucA/NucB deoxyribonuclease domain-containing protein n=1 Tax=Streptomyces sp. NBC_01220 TaxID=2903781 RepID=UPI002F9146F5|nr:NucA/NucB deoxyribonuclease domain-containing protein [Streptomyces sp. NBC_01220]
MPRSFLGLRKNSGRPAPAPVRRFRIPLVGALVLALSIPAALTPIAAAEDAFGIPPVPKPQSNPVKAVTTPGAKEARQRVAKNRAANNKQAAKARSERTVIWPKPSKQAQKITDNPADSIVSITAAEPSKGLNKAATTPAAGTATVNLLDQKTTRNAGITGVVFTAAAEAPGSAKISVEYRSFGSAVGGNWAGRLGLVTLPACALTTPAQEQCRKQIPVTSHNNLADQTVTAQVDLPPAGKPADTTGQTANSGAVKVAAPATVFALTAAAEAPASATGDYKATPLSASSTWEADGSSGSFTWDYPITVPPAAAGPAPSLSLSYNSGSIDGRTANTNNQGSMVGEGFDLTSSYIERRYGSCDDDGQSDKFDLCWKYENASLVLNGKANELVKDDTTGVWHLKNDDASQVIHRVGAANGDEGDDISAEGKSGDGKGEYWQVITGDGTTYTFGLNKLDGATTERTNSVWTVPVFGDDPQEPGYTSGTSFTGRSKKQAWRWNLDQTTDIHGNAATYWYTADTNNYAKNGDKGDLDTYTRGGYLNEIKYGQRATTLFSGTPSGKVTFTYAERCFTGCASLTEDTADNWPDVPFDAICSASETDCKGTGPSFFTRKRLAAINTSVWSTAAEPDAYKPVDSYALTQEYLDGADIGNSSDQSLVLKSVQRTALNGAAIKLDPVDLDYQMRPNRVYTSSQNAPRMNRPRLATITSETGAITTVTLSQPECVIGSNMPKAEDDNALNCYPVIWPLNGGDPILDWFHKYNVEAVTVADPAAKNVLLENSYTYEDPAWHYNDDPFTAEKDRTWSAWRGYRTVTSYTGDIYHTQSKTVRVYMQGMNGDKRKNGATRAASVPGISIDGFNATAATDAEQYAGFLRQEIIFNGAHPVTVTFNSIWNKETASQQRSYADTKAYFVRTSRTGVSTYLPVTGKWRQTATNYYYDSAYGMQNRVDAAGDTAKIGDETCTRTWYARNPDAGLTGLVSRTRVTANACYDSAGAAITDDKLALPTSTATRGDVLSDTAVVYDTPNATGWVYAQTPTLGLPTWAGRAKAYPAPTGAADRHPAVNGGWQTTAKTTYDTATAKLGRPLTVTDAKGHTTTTTYYPAAVGPLTSTVLALPKLAGNGQQHKTYTYYDPARATVTYTLDANLKKTENTYDALGRITATWTPDRSKSGNDSATVTYGYHYDRTGQPWTSVSTLKADGQTYQTSYAITDSLLRPIQTQTPSVTGGRILTDTRYDSRGLAFETHADIYDSTTSPIGGYARADFAHTPALTETEYDGAGRPVSSTLNVLGIKKWTTTTSYTGDSTATTALIGGNATRTITDALGRTTETRTYAGATPADPAYGATTGPGYTSVKTQYTPDSKQKLITAPDTAQWSYAYDLFGRQTSTTDPDRGTTTTTYTDLDQVDTTTDANQNTLLYSYDELGRKTDQWQTSRTDANKLAHWSFDSILKGMPDGSTRYTGGSGTTGKAYTKQITAYDTRGHATGTRLTLPSDDLLVTSGAVTSTLDFETAYRLDGTLGSTTEPAVASLPHEITQTKYNAGGLPNGLSGNSDYVQNVAYSQLGQVWQLRLGVLDTKTVSIANNYEAGTGRLTNTHVTDETHPYMLQDLDFSQDQAGNVTSIFDKTNLGGTSKTDNQCFTYDAYLRLSEAWTPQTANCATTGRTTGNLDGAAPYWNSYTYNTAGQRKTETTHTSTGNATTNYNYGTITGQPHPLANTTGARAATYSYDDTGNTEQRPGTQATQTLTWNAEGKLASTTEPPTGSKLALSTNYLYDADGQLLIRRATGDGATVLYLGATEVRLTTTGTNKTITGTRYYNIASQNVAVRTATTGILGSKLSFLAADHHGTSSLAIDATTQAVTKRYTTPFGAPRGTEPTNWPDDKAFLGKPADIATGLTHVGAREYDPTTGQFISVDPILNLAENGSFNGYSYANNAPATLGDPTGLDPCGGLKCGHEGDRCADPAIYCHSEKKDGTANVQAPLPGEDIPLMAEEPLKGEVVTPGSAMRVLLRVLPSIAGKFTREIDMSDVWRKFFPKPVSLTDEEWEQLVSACVASQGMSEAGCRQMPVFVVDGKRTPKIAINDKSAIDSGHPFVLHYNADSEEGKDNRELAGCRAAWGGPQSCDEYPFASTLEGGIGAQTMAVPYKPEQIYQRIDLSAFYRSNKLTRGDAFMVTVINVRRVNGIYISG